MPYTPPLNRFLFVLYLVTVIGVFAMALLFPEVRGVAYAPVRDTLFAPEPIVLPVVYSTEKESWLEEIRTEFENSSEYQINGRSIVLEMEATGSREMVLNVLDGTSQPALISPASSLQSAILESDSAARFGAPLVTSRACQSVVETPLVLVAWKERADVLWGDVPPTDFWRQLAAAAVNEQGWAAYNQPDWGFVKFSHTDPSRSNSGFMTLLLMSYGYFDKTAGLTNADILNPEFQQWLIATENTISEFGDSTGTYMQNIVAFGPSRYDLVTVYEATAIEQAANAANRYGELRVYYPPATIMSDHPFCVVDGEWVSEEQAQAAELFIQFLQSEEAQTAALVEHGFRPVSTAVDLNTAGSPFTTNTTIGLQTTLPSEIETPDGNVLNTLLEVWSRNVRP